MNSRIAFYGFGLLVLSMSCALMAAPTERIRNEKVLVLEQTLAPGELLSLPGDRAGVVIYLDAGSVAAVPAGGNTHPRAVQRGDTLFQPPGAGTVRNAGDAPLRIVWAEYLGKGNAETWGTNGLSPNYRLLFENQYGRVYTVRIRAGTSEPRHSHHDRVVVCLSGAELLHEMPDGRREISTLKTGEITWRRGGTHIGHNQGKTDLWVVAIEPK
jgi:oxalate decarboxylase/phosphoglucose isomerase-like protein (cupin superfamily)